MPLVDGQGRRGLGSSAFFGKKRRRGEVDAWDSSRPRPALTRYLSPKRSPRDPRVRSSALSLGSLRAAREDTASMRRFWIFGSGCCVCLLLGSLLACGSDPDSPNDAGRDSAVPDTDATTAEPSAQSGEDSPSLYRLRNEAKLHADRHSEEGYSQAAALYGEAVVRPEASWIDYLNQARCLVFTSQFAEAKAALEGARRLRDSALPDAAIDYVDGLYHKRIDEHELALALFANVAGQSPSQIQPWYQKGFAEERTKHWSDAQASYERALEIDPTFRAAAYRLVIVLRQLGAKEKELVAFERFSAMSEDAQPDPEKCGFTKVSLLPAQRDSVEPPPVDLGWREVMTDWKGATSATDIARLDALQGAPGGRVADLDNDGATDLVESAQSKLRVVWGDAAAASFDATTQVTTELGNVSSTGALELFDLDHDGDLDLLGAFAEGAAVPVFSWIRNNGDRTFTAMPSFEDESGSPISPREDLAVGRASFDVHDFDEGNDLDIVIAGGRVPLVLMNLRDGSFLPLSASKMDVQDWVRGADLNNDGSPDLFAVRNSGQLSPGGDAGSSPTATWTVSLQDSPAGRLAEAHWPTAVTGRLDGHVRDVVLEDVDNDGDLDAVLATSNGVVWLHNSNGTFALADQWADASGSEAVVTMDLSGDGQVEVIAKGPTGIRVLAATQPSPYPAWIVRPTGGRDNLQAIGTVVDQFAGGLFQTRMIKGPGGVRFGLGSSTLERVDGLRLRWPQGIVQPEARNDFTFTDDAPAASQLPVVELTQEEGLVASCPFLYARGPEGWTFLTDVVGIAPLDEWLPAGQKPHLDPEEYVRIEGDALVEVAGRLHLAITEELRETTYLDRLELVCVEHDAGSTLFSDESSNQGAYDRLTTFVFSNDQFEVAKDVRFDDGTVATDRVAKADRAYAHAYSASFSQWSGWVDRYNIRMIAPAGTASILLTGRIGWYDSTVSYALHQHGRTWGPLQLLRPEDGAILVDDLGLPAGMDRTMVSVFEEPLAVDTEVVLSGHHRFLWDRILFAPAPVVYAPEASPISSIESKVLPLRSAELGFHGYSRMVGDRPQHEQTYVFADASPHDDFGPAYGKATRYGDVLPLLARHDDELIVLVAGDKVELEFDAPAPLAEGRARTYFLRTSGWAKEGSFHNRTGRWIEPLPFRAMSTYPPPRDEMREDADYQVYRSTYQTRETAPLQISPYPS